MRTLALLLALVLAPQAALASVAAFPETALRGDREISAIRVGSNARQLAETRQETACFYDANASAMTDDPINHRDPTGRLLDVLAVGLLFGPKAAAGYAVRVGQHLLSALADTTSTMCGPACALLDEALGQPLRPETALEGDSQAGFLEKLNPLNQALRSGLTAGESTGFEQGVQLADTAKGAVDAGLLAVGGARLLTGGSGALRNLLRPEPPSGAGSGLTRQTREQLEASRSSFEKLIIEHRQKLDDYRANPEAFDNKGTLRGAPDDLKPKIIAGRIKALEKQLAKQEGELRKVIEQLEGDN